MRRKDQRCKKNFLNNPSSEGNAQSLNWLCFFISKKEIASLALAWGFYLGGDL